MKTASKVALTFGTVIAGFILMIGACMGIVGTVSTATWYGVKGIWK